MTPVINTQLEDMTEYEQLVSRLEHIDRAFIVRRNIKLHYAKQMPDVVTAEYIEVVKKYPEFFKTFEESLLWFISVEMHSRFLAGSKRGVYKFICNMQSDREKFKDELIKIGHKHQEVICHIKTQRDKFFAHADDVSWRNFPNLFDKELEALIKDLKTLLNDIGETINEQRRVTMRQNLAEANTNALFDDLLLFMKPDVDINSLSKTYDDGVEDFLKG